MQVHAAGSTEELIRPQAEGLGLLEGVPPMRVGAKLPAHNSVMVMVPLPDLEFSQGFNPMVHYSLKRLLNHTQLFQITPSGLLIARANHLRALQQYALQV